MKYLVKQIHTAPIRVSGWVETRKEENRNYVYFPDQPASGLPEYYNEENKVRRLDGVDEYTLDTLDYQIRGLRELLQALEERRTDFIQIAYSRSQPVHFDEKTGKEK